MILESVELVLLQTNDFSQDSCMDGVDFDPKKGV